MKYGALGSAHSENEIGEAADELVFEHTQVVLVELDVGLSASNHYYLKSLSSSQLLFKYRYHILINISTSPSLIINHIFELVTTPS